MVTIGFPVSAGSNGRIGSKSENKKEFTLMAKLWAGRFGKETDLEVNDFNSSISFDCRLYKEDITGSMAMRLCWASRESLRRKNQTRLSKD